MDIKKKPWSSSSKYFIPFHMGLMVITAILIFFVSRAEASDPNNEAYCLAQNMYFEAGNQPLAGKIAVSQVVINRTQHMNYPTDICGVVYQAKWSENWKGNMIPTRNQCQFSWFCDGKPDTPRTKASYNLAHMIAWVRYKQKDSPVLPSNIYWYHAITVNPYWADAYSHHTTIGDHLFYSDR